MEAKMLDLVRAFITNEPRVRMAETRRTASSIELSICTGRYG